MCFSEPDVGFSYFFFFCFYEFILATFRMAIWINSAAVRGTVGSSEFGSTSIYSVDPQTHNNWNCRLTDKTYWQKWLASKLLLRSCQNRENWKSRLRNKSVHHRDCTLKSNSALTDLCLCALKCWLADSYTHNFFQHSQIFCIVSINILPSRLSRS